MIETLLRRALFMGLLTAPFACSSGNGKSGDQELDDGSSGGASNASSATNGASTTNGVAGSINANGGSSVIDVNGEACAADVTKADLVDIDIHLMLDSSASMLDVLPGGNTKWEAVVNSLIDFVEDPASAEIGVGLQYFPKLRANTSLECNTNADCGAGAGPCSSSACLLAGNVQGQSYLAVGPDTSLTTCDDDNACPADEACGSWLGVCAAPDAASGETLFVADAQDNVIVCATNADCPTGTCDTLGYCENPDDQGQPILCSARVLGCPAQAGDCYLIPYTCTNATLCEASDYSTPAVEISAAANRNDALIASLTGHEPEGLTPTAPALQGAIQHARDRESADPNRKVVAVLATDGFPTVCDPLEIADISDVAQAGVQGTPAVETYVIGVFSNAEADEARANLDQIAEAGGTRQAFVISTGSDVASEFLQALNEIRGAALTCDFAIPEPPSGETLDFGQVNLEFVDSDGTSHQLVNVSDEGACTDAPASGWYYVRDEQSNQPSQISVCPEVCTAFQAAMGASEVNLQIGCATIIK